MMLCFLLYAGTIDVDNLGDKYEFSFFEDES